jgi:hypothetical protein
MNKKNNVSISLRDIIIITFENVLVYRNENEKNLLAVIKTLEGITKSFEKYDEVFKYYLYKILYTAMGNSKVFSLPFPIILCLLFHTPHTHTHTQFHINIL